MIIRLCPPPQTHLSPIHFRETDMTTKNSGGFIGFSPPPTKTNFLAPSTNGNIEITKISIQINLVHNLRMP